MMRRSICIQGLAFCRGVPPFLMIPYIASVPESWGWPGGDQTARRCLRA